MSDTLYDEDVLAWSEQQAAALRARAGANALDYDNLAEEIEDVGKSILHACQSQVANILEHLLKIEFVGPSQVVPHWKGELIGFRTELDKRLTASIRNRLVTELDRDFASALKRLVVRELLSAPDSVYDIRDGYSWEQIADRDWYPEPRYD